jgi:hypothetical protein
MARKSEKDTSEKLQIAMLTFGMTGAGFAILAVILALFLNPRAAARVDNLKAEYKRLTSYLVTERVRNLRAQDKLNEGQENTRGIREIISQALDSRQLQQGTFPMPKRTELKKGGGLEKIEQTIDVRSAKLLQILQFLGDVKDAKKTIQVESVNIWRDRKTQDDDSWNATLRFADYERKK